MKVIAVETGAESLLCAVVDGEGSVSGRRAARLAAADFESRVMQVVGLIQEAALGCEEIDSVAVAVHGVYSAATGTVRWGRDEFSLLDALRAHLSLPLEIESRRLAAILGEQWLGAAREARDAVYLRMGPPLEAGILAGGRLIRGAHDAAGANVDGAAALVAALDPEVVILHPGFEFTGGVESPLGRDAALLGVARAALGW